MKYFRCILLVMWIVVPLLFVADIFFMVQLYGSIKARYIDDVEQSLRRADQIEMVDRIVASGLAEDADVVWINLGLKKSEVAGGDYSQGYRRPDKQLLSEINHYLHADFGDALGAPDLEKMTAALRRDLSFSGYTPAEVYIQPGGTKPEHDSWLWHIEYRVDGTKIYDAYISPLTANILAEMGGVIVSSALIALVLSAGFLYLLHVIRRLRSIEEMKDDFTNNMTHELKTPIAIAFAANDALLHFPDTQDTERTRRYLSAAMEQLGKLSGLVESILAMSMERRKELVMEKEDLPLKPFLTSIVEQHRLRADKNCRINLHCDENTVVLADPVHFSNVMSNLIDNSLKYSGEEVEIGISADANSVSVSDNGYGIAEKVIPYIFNRFYRGPQDDKYATRGYGIGLYYVKAIVDKHGWAIEVHSKPGIGSTFTIKFQQQ